MPDGKGCQTAVNPIDMAPTLLHGMLTSMLDPKATDRRAKDEQNALVARMGGREAALLIGPRGASPAPRH